METSMYFVESALSNFSYSGCFTHAKMLGISWEVRSATRMYTEVSYTQVHGELIWLDSEASLQYAEPLQYSVLSWNEMRWHIQYNQYRAYLKLIILHVLE